MALFVVVLGERSSDAHCSRKTLSTQSRSSTVWYQKSLQSNHSKHVSLLRLSAGRPVKHCFTSCPNMECEPWTDTITHNNHYQTRWLCVVVVERGGIQTDTDSHRGSRQSIYGCSRRRRRRRNFVFTVCYFMIFYVGFLFQLFVLVFSLVPAAQDCIWSLLARSYVPFSSLTEQCQSWERNGV